jgi:hypothetical protein
VAPVLTATAWAILSAPFMLARGISRGWQSRSAQRPRPASALRPPSPGAPIRRPPSPPTSATALLANPRSGRDA